MAARDPLKIIRVVDENMDNNIELGVITHYVQALLFGLTAVPEHADAVRHLFWHLTRADCDINELRFACGLAALPAYLRDITLATEAYVRKALRVVGARIPLEYEPLIGATARLTHEIITDPASSFAVKLWLAAVQDPDYAFRKMEKASKCTCK